MSEGIPENVHAALQAAAERHSMMAEDYRHRIMDLFNTLDEEQLVSLKWMLHNITMESPSQLSAMYEGQITVIMEKKFGLCAGCGINHEKEAKALAAQSDPAVPTKATNPVDAEAREQLATPTEPSKYVNQFGDLTEDDLRNMEIYHLDDVRDEENGYALLGFICTGIIGGPRGGCGMRYGSIADRMLRPPEECTGCFTKAAHG